MIIRLLFLLTSPVQKETLTFTVTSPSAEIEAIWIPDDWKGPVVAIPLDEIVLAGDRE